ncbi:hypothetical protein [Terrarubrum flagellatum]|uniref:hypothetical protein n=1 Tax=Terrirubrum flagellatum TaxID=2895980 RepID=UPI0031452DF5
MTRLRAHDSPRWSPYRFAMKSFRRILWVIVALIFLGAAWVWDHLHPVVAALIAALPLERLKQAVRRFIERLPPYPTLIVFLIPAIAHELMKAGAFWLFASNSWVWGVFVYLLADIVGIALCAFIFETNREKLLSIPWFARGYGWFAAAHHWARAQIIPMRLFIARALEEAGLRGGRAGIFTRIMAVWRYARRRVRAA